MPSNRPNRSPGVPALTRPMSARVSAGLLAGVLAVLLPFLPLAVGWLAPGQALAESAGDQRKTPLLRNDVYEQLMEAQELADGGRTREALAVLDGLSASRKRRELNSFELANLYSFYAFVYYEQEQYGRAIDAYKQVLAQPDIPRAMEESTQYSLAQLYFVREDYPGAIRALKRWFALAESPQPDAYILLAQAYYQTRDYDRALRNVEQGLALAQRQGKPPKENWYLLMRVLYYDKGNLKKTAWVMEELLRRWPKREYLMQASGLYGELGNERRQVAAMEAAYVMGWLEREQDLLNMAYLFISTQTPYKAAGVLQRGLDAGQIGASSKHYALLGNALQAARETERAIPAMVKAAELADDGEPWARLASLYLDHDDYAKAVEAGRSALRRGQLKRPDETRLVMGMALFNLDRLDAAREQFEAASRYKRSERTAGNWIEYLNSEQQRRAALEDGWG